MYLLYVERKYLYIMNELIKIETMTSVQIAEVTGKRHADVLRDIRNLVEQLDDEGKRNFASADYRDEQGKKRPMFELTKKGCLCLASGYDANLRMKIINRWEELETKERQSAKEIALPQTYLEALKALVASEEKRLEAERKNAILMHVNTTYTATEIAKELNMKSANELNKALSDMKIQYRIGKTWVLYSQYSNKGYEEIKQETLDNGKVVYHRKFTQLGRDFILGLFNDKVEDKK